MKPFLKPIFFMAMIAGLFSLAFTAPMLHYYGNTDCQPDSTRIAVVEFMVIGMDSISVADVQDRLDETCGVSFNFACWADTVVFVEYDSLLTNKIKLMEVIAEMGYKTEVRLTY
jgi:hypothetical protein